MNDVTLLRVTRSEWIKLATLRSVVISYTAIAATMTLMALIYLTLPGADGGAVNAALTTLLLVELLVGTTGVLAASSEYSTHTIRATLTAVPGRLLALAAKLVVHGGLVAALMIPATVPAVVGGAILAPDEVGSITDNVVARALLGTTLALACVCVLGVALGVLTRSAAAGIGVLFTLVFLPVIVVTMPEVTAYLPGRAILAIVMSDYSPEAQLLPAPAAVLVLLGWLVVAVAAAALALRRRDA